MDLKLPNPTGRDRDQHHTRFVVPRHSSQGIMVCLEGHCSYLQGRKGQSPGCHMPFHGGGEYGPDLASTL